MIPKIGVLGFTVALDGFSRCGMVPMGPGSTEDQAVCRLDR